MIPDFARFSHRIGPLARRGATPPYVDMGQGRRLGPEDVLDGHFRRMTTQRTRTETVAVQCSDSLTAAITVLAPELTPLTDLAEDLATRVPDVQPEAQFRADLHRALEATHRQHTAQRTLGTRLHPTTVTQDRSTLPWALTGLFFMLLLLFWRRQRRHG